MPLPDEKALILNPLNCTMTLNSHPRRLPLSNSPAGEMAVFISYCCKVSAPIFSQLKTNLPVVDWGPVTS